MVWPTLGSRTAKEQEQEPAHLGSHRKRAVKRVCVCVNVVSKTEFYAALNTIKSKVQYTKYKSKVGN